LTEKAQDDIDESKKSIYYSEKTHDGKKIYLVEEESIVIKGNVYFTSDFEITFSLKDLNPIPDKIRARSNAFNYGLICAAIFLVGTNILQDLANLKLLDQPIPLFYVFGMAGVWLMFRTFKKVEWASFKNKNGEIVLSIAKSGKRKNEFDGFIKMLRKRIESQSS